MRARTITFGIAAIAGVVSCGEPTGTRIEDAPAPGDSAPERGGSAQDWYTGLREDTDGTLYLREYEETSTAGSVTKSDYTFLSNAGHYWRAIDELSPCALRFIYGIYSATASAVEIGATTEMVRESCQDSFVVGDSWPAAPEGSSTCPLQADGSFMWGGKDHLLFVPTSPERFATAVGLLDVHRD